MPLMPDMLADALLKGLGSPKDKDNNAISATTEMKAFANGVISMFKAGAISGPVTGFGVPNGGPFTGESNSKFVNLQPAVMAQIVQAAVPTGVPTKILSEAKAVAQYFMSVAVAKFANVSGICTAVTGTPPTPGILTGGTATGGKLMSIDGKALAAMVATECGLTDAKDLSKMYDELCKYLQQNIVLTYPPGTINGTFPLPGPIPIPIVGGAGSGGIIS